MKKAIIILFLLTALVENSKTQNINLMNAPKTESEMAAFENSVLQNAPSENAFVAVQRMAERYIYEKNWDKTAKIFKMYKPFFPLMENRFEKILELVNQKDHGLVVSNLGSGINTDSNEYLPKVTLDGNFLYFCGDNRPGGIGGEDIFCSELKDSKWLRAYPLDRKINTNENEAITAISADGNDLVLFGNYQMTYGGGDLYYFEKTKTGWSEIKHFPKPINSLYFDADGSFTSDGKSFIFVSDRRGVLGEYHEKGAIFHGSNSGNTDIFICTKTKTGWSEPINLGNNINTPFAERTPYLHPDGKTLYFSSDGHHGLGRLDVFKSTRLNDTSWIEWSEPVNLGKEINTPDNDWGYQIATNGDLAYFSSRNRKDSYGKEDIYSVTLSAAQRPKMVATISGKVTDDNNSPLEAKILWEDLSRKINIGSLRTNPNDGKYFVVLPLGKKYGYYAEKEGYYPVSKNIDLTDTTKNIDLKEDIVLILIDSMRKNTKWISLNNLFFDVNKFNLNSESFPELDRLVDLLNAHKGYKIEIAGHTDNSGSDQFNLTLSKNRAEAVREYLISKGIDAGTVSAQGYGKEKPIASNKSEHGREKNRRVEFRLVK